MQDLRPIFGQGMNFTEYDLDLETGGSGWVAERASLSAVQRDSLLASIRHPVPAEKRSEFAFWLDHLFAQIVRDFGNRLDATGGSRRSGGAIPRKLSTRVRDELTKIRRVLSKASVVVQGLSPDARDATAARLRELGAAGGMSVSAETSFWLTWGRVHEAFLDIQFACRTSDAVEGGISKAVHAELRKIENALDDLSITLDDASHLRRSNDAILLRQYTGSACRRVGGETIEAQPATGLSLGVCRTGHPLLCQPLGQPFLRR